MSDVRTVLQKIKNENLDMVDVKFVDLHGIWQHFSIPATELSEDTFENGLGFDGSSIRGFQEINESDMLLMPDPSTAFTDPFSSKTISLICTIKDPVTKEKYSRDPRYIAEKAAEHLKKTGVGDISYWGPEAEFFIFDSVRYSQNEYSSCHAINSEEGIWNSGRENEKDNPNLGFKIPHKQGYFPVPPSDTLQELRNDIIRTMIRCGIHIEVHHHEVATAGQCEIDMRFDSLVQMADKLMLYKYIVKNVARSHGKTATFMPKPIFNDNGSGMHCHQSIWKDGKNVFFDAQGYAGISQTAKWYIGGLLKHAPALCAFIAPGTNSYKRLVPGFEAPVNLVYSQRNRSAAVRIPLYSQSEKAKRIEFRTPDPSCNPYLAFAAMLMAGLDGVKNKIDPGEPTDVNLYELEGEAAAKIKSVPSSLKDALEALKADHAFLLDGGVFTKDLIDTWIKLKTEEVDAIRLRPHPWEFHLYYDA
ncbi:MAG: type I glutamate--ammonia ligase [Candidatus Woesearchaeota archaeon]|nr:type I glutamate--ammonia ligase [Candidatus Woesearchaeota archaeon]